MKIRKCVESDIPAVGRFYDRTVEYLDEHINYPKWTYKVYPSEISARAMTAEGSQYMGEKEGKIIAAFVLNTDPQGNYGNGNWRRNLAIGEYLIIHALAVDPDERGKGLASEIVRFCVEKAKSEGCKALRVDIVPTNFPARKFHEKNGFTYAGDADLERGMEEIPEFSLYELNL